jgi:hypothetical protein
MPNGSAKHYCFTINNPTDEETQTLQAIGSERPEGILYLVYGREKGEEGTPHLQGFISFDKRRTLKWVKRLISNRAHLETARGTPKQASEYCKKDGDFEEFGICPRGAGARNDLKAVATQIKQGATLRAIAEEHPEVILRYGSGVQRLRMFHRPVERKVPEIWTLWGKTGSGKTRRVWEFADVERMWVHPGDRWFDGYDSHPAVLFDDFDGGWFKLSYLLKLLDRYTFQVPVKGGYTWWCPSTIYITSNLKPQEWYPNAHQEHRDALIRRLREFGTIQECHNY